MCIHHPSRFSAANLATRSVAAFLRSKYCITDRHPATPPPHAATQPQVSKWLSHSLPQNTLLETVQDALLVPKNDNHSSCILLNDWRIESRELLMFQGFDLCDIEYAAVTVAENYTGPASSVLDIRISLETVQQSLLSSCLEKPLGPFVYVKIYLSSRKHVAQTGSNKPKSFVTAAAASVSFTFSFNPCILALLISLW